MKHFSLETLACRTVTRVEYLFIILFYKTGGGLSTWKTMQFFILQFVYIYYFLSIVYAS